MINPSLQTKLDRLSSRYQEVSELLSKPEIITDQDRFRDLSKEYAQLEPVVQCFLRYQENNEAIEQAREMTNDPDLAELAGEEIANLTKKQEKVFADLQILLLPEDPNDKRDVFLEIRAGTGGHEAAIFAGDLLQMYARYVEKKRWKMTILSASEGEHGGFKEVITQINGQGVYSRLKFESGVHRVQRVPETESQGRIHTSACTVAILPVIEEIDSIEIDPSELRIDTFRSSGAGGQHVNTTDSAVRITHLPSGTVVECQDERSQHKNRAKALSLLQSKLLMLERTKAQQAQAQTRRDLVGSGDRSERIRTYNFPQGRVTDHRINLTLYQLPQVMEGDLDHIVDPLIQEHQADLLASIEE